MDKTTTQLHIRLSEIATEYFSLLVTLSSKKKSLQPKTDKNGKQYYLASQLKTRRVNEYGHRENVERRPYILTDNAEKIGGDIITLSIDSFTAQFPRYLVFDMLTELESIEKISNGKRVKFYTAAPSTNTAAPSTIKK